MSTGAHRRIFDAHFHIGPYGKQSFERHSIRPISEALDHADGVACQEHLTKNDLWGGVIVPTYLEDQRAAFRYNRLLIHAVSQHSALYGGLWVSPLPETEDLCTEALRLLPHPKIRALKLASNTWRPYGINPQSWTSRIRHNVERILAAARDHELVIHMHTGHADGADPHAFQAFMQHYGMAATYQFVHMGEAIAPMFAFVPRFVEWIERGCAVYTDTSLAPGFGPPWLLAELDRRNLGCSRVLFATDAPWGRFAAEYAKLHAMDVSDAVRDHLFWKNAAALYRLAE